MGVEDKFLILLDKVSEISERTARIEVQLDAVKTDVNFIKIEDKKQNELLDTHIQGTVTNTNRLNLEIEARHLLETRMTRLEKIPNFMKSVYSILMYVGAIVGIIYETGRILKKW